MISNNTSLTVQVFYSLFTHEEIHHRVFSFVFIWKELVSLSDATGTRRRVHKTPRG